MRTLTWWTFPSGQLPARHFPTWLIPTGGWDVNTWIEKFLNDFRGLFTPAWRLFPSKTTWFYLFFGFLPSIGLLFSLILISFSFQGKIVEFLETCRVSDLHWKSRGNLRRKLVLTQIKVQKMTEALLLQTRSHFAKVHPNVCLMKYERVKLTAIDGALIFRKIEFWINSLSVWEKLPEFMPRNWLEF